MKQGDFQTALDNLPETPSGNVLDGFERGRLQLLAGQYVESQASLEKADKQVVEKSRQAVLRLSSGADQVGSLLVNDSVIDYTPSDYELGFLHLYRALNFMATNDLTGALVEARRANKVQENARKLREAALEEAESEARNDGISDDNLGSVLSRYPSAGKKLAAVQNGYLFYLSALLYEAEGNLNDAYIDYTRALAVAPNNAFIADAAMRVARKQSRKSDLKRLEKKFGSFQRPAKTEGRSSFSVSKALFRVRKTGAYR
ncbi:hypothetical protein [Veronia nyctiphanis]|uniref:hypothetical protein n=1 Tax=Veronia nyctiphanis TaxID=1278244 RepID=UPI001F2CB692|nr:hypothetical protein [Veronia nyctiphanis]